MLAAAAVLMVALVTTFTSTVWAQTGGGTGTGGTGPGPGTPALRFAADAAGAPPETIQLPSPGSTATLFIYASGLIPGEMEVVQVLVSHNPSVTAITGVECVGVYAGAVEGGPTAQGGQTRFACALGDDPDNPDDAAGPLASEGPVARITITRTGPGFDTLELLGLDADPDFGTAFYHAGDATSPFLGDSVSTSFLASPTATPSPTATTPPSGGGGGFSPPPPPPQNTASPPGMPLNVTAQPGDRSAVISWDPPTSNGGAQVLSYTVSIVGSSLSQSVPSPVQALTFTGLQNGFEYRFRVAAANSAGTGQASEPTGFVVPAGPPSPPQNVIVGVQSGAVGVTWDPPLNGNGAPVESYTVSEIDGKLPPVSVEAPVTSYVFTGLGAGSYSFTVTAAHRGGESEPSAPSAPVIVTGGTVTPTATPTPTPGPAPVPPLTEQEQSLLAEQLSAALQQPVRVTGSEFSIRSDSRGVVVRLPAVAENGGPPASGFTGFSGGGLVITAQNGQPTRMSLTVSGELSLGGNVSFEVSGGEVHAVLTDTLLMFAPATPDLASIGVSGGLITSVSARFEARIIAADGAPALSAQFSGTLGSPLPVSFASVQLALSGEGWSIPSGTGNVALAVDVTTAGPGQATLGATTALFSVSSAWAQSQQAAGRALLIVKVGGGGTVYVREAECQPAGGGVHSCSAIFDGAAAGFSVYALVSASATSQATPQPTATATPSAAPSATPSSTALPPTATGLPQPSPTAASGTAVEPAPTPLPTLTLGDPGGGSAIAIIGIAVGFGTALLLMAGYFINRRRGSVASFIVAVSLAGSAALLIVADGSAQTGPAGRTAAPGREETRSSGKVAFDASLTALRRDYREFVRAPKESGVPHPRYMTNVYSQSAPRTRLPEVTDEKVLIEVVSIDPEQVAKELKKLGVEDIVSAGRAVSGRVYVASLPLLETLSVPAFVRYPHAETSAFLSSGLAVSQGDAAMRGGQARQAHGVDGRAVRIGVISDSYNCDGGAQDDAEAGEIPATVTVLMEGPCPAGDEGRAMMQLIYDVAPGAELLFHTGFGGMAVMANGIRALADAGADIIVDDVGYFAAPFFQDGIIAQAVDEVTARGVTYFSSAGNSGDRSYEAEFRPSQQKSQDAYPPCDPDDSGTYFWGGAPHNFRPFGPPFGPPVIFQDITIPSGTSRLVIQWEQPAISAGGPPNQSEVDAYIFNVAETCIYYALTDYNMSTGEPVEYLELGHSSPLQAKLMVVHYSHSHPGRIKAIAFGNVSFDSFATNSSTIFGHSNAAGAIAVGAVDYRDTPEFGGGPLQPQSFSSTGGTRVYFRPDGSRHQSPVIRQKPDVMAPDNTNNSFFPGPGSDIDGDGFPNFRGTSAAAPHAAAVAALLLELKSDLYAEGLIGPHEVRETLRRTALDMGSPGFDFASGYGLADALAAADFLAARDVPRAGHDSFFIAVNSTLDIPSPGVLVNDSSSADMWSVWLDGPFVGAFNSPLEPDGSFTYQPPHNFVGTAAFTYFVDDGLFAPNAANSGTVTIDIAGVGTITASVALQGVGEGALFGQDTPMLVLVCPDRDDIAAPFVPGHNGPLTVEKLGPGDYTLRLSAPGFLSAERNGIPVTDVAATFTIEPHVELLMGDANHDARIDMADAVTVAAAFGTVAGTEGSRRDAGNNVVDMNGDGVVNGYDLSMVIANLGAAGPSPW